jgi:hypothetical protein
VLRESTYEIVLVPDGGGAPQVLASRRYYQNMKVASRLTYRVAPDGDWAAYAGPDDELHLRPAQGPEIVLEHVKHGFAFAPDGRSVAVALTRSSTRFRTVRRWMGTSQHEEDEIAIVDLPGGARHALGTAFDVQRMEWIQGGLVVAQQVRRDERQHGVDGWHWMWDRELTLFRTDQEPTALFRGDFGRFTAAARGSRVLYFSRAGVYELDAWRPERPPRKLDVWRDDVGNAEISADGAIALFGLQWSYGSAKKPRVFLVDGAGPRPVGDDLGDLWFADQGRAFVFSSGARLFYGEGTALRELHFGETPQTEIDSVRFRRDGRGLVGVRGNQVLAWDPAQGREVVREVVLYTEPDAQQKIIGAEHFRGGLLLWRERPDRPAR